MIKAKNPPQKNKGKKAHGKNVIFVYFLRIPFNTHCENCERASGSSSTKKMLIGILSWIIIKWRCHSPLCIQWWWEGLTIFYAILPPILWLPLWNPNCVDFYENYSLSHSFPFLLLLACLLCCCCCCCST